MAWRDEYRRASFRDVEFDALNLEDGVGRRTAEHVYPHRDLPYVEDLGRKAAEFTLEGVIVGPEYIAQKNALVAACEKPGSGVLIHPTRGALLVVCRGLRTRETADKGGSFEISLLFQEAGRLEFPTVTVDTVGAAELAAEAVDTASTEDLVEQVTTTGPEFILEATANAGRAAVEKIRSFPLVGAIQKVADYKQLTEQYLNEVGDYATDAVIWARESVKLLTNLDDVFDEAIATIDALLLIAESIPDVAGGSSTFQAQADTNSEVSTAWFANNALAKAVSVAAEASWETTEEATAVRDQLAAAIKVQTSNARGPVVGALQDLLASLLDAVPAPGVDLPSLAEFSPVDVTTALHVAYTVHDDVGRSDEIIARNRISKPGFIPGGQALEVLSV